MGRIEFHIIAQDGLITPASGLIARHSRCNAFRLSVMNECQLQGSEQGVSKSGSPIPNEITSFIVATISKNFRIPDGFKLITRCAR